METLGKFTFTIFIGTLSSIYGGFVLSKLFNWLLVPTFGWDRITTINGMSILLVIGLTTAPIIMNKKTDPSEDVLKTAIVNTISLLFLYTFLLGIGYMYSLFI